MISAGLRGHKQIVGTFLFIYTHNPSVFPLHNLLFYPKERSVFSRQRNGLLSILIPMWIVESYKPIPANSTGLMGLLYCISLSETDCQSWQSCTSKQEVENCVVTKGTHTQTQTEHVFLLFSFFFNQSQQFIAVVSMFVCFWCKIPSSPGTSPKSV